MAIRNFSDGNPPAPAGHTNTKWQLDLTADPPDMSVYMPLFIGDGDPSSPLAPPESGAVPAPEAGDAAAGKFLFADGTWEIPAGVTGGIRVREVPAGALDGSNAVFTLSFTPSPADSLTLKLNGVEQNPGSGSPLTGADYSIAGSTITYTVAPRADDWHLAFYTH